MPSGSKCSYPEANPMEGLLPLKTPGLAPSLMQPAPSAGDLEIALDQLLRKGRYAGPGHVKVVAVGIESSPVYLVSLGADAAKVLGSALAPVLGTRSQPSPVSWVLFRSDAAAILRTAR
jgi:hypothetical protein